MKSLKTSTAIAGLAAVTLLEISAATPVVAQGVNPFSGGYVGSHIGFAWSDTNFTSGPYTISGLEGNNNIVPVPGRNDNFDLDGLIGGIHSGFNFVNQGNILFGFETDITVLNNNDTISFNSGEIDYGGGDGVVFQHRSDVNLEWQGTIRGRLGFTAGNALFFATAGIAFLNAEWKETATITDCLTDGCGNANDITTMQMHSDSETLVGPVVGVGMEIFIAPNIIFGGDYLYENFDAFGSAPFGHISPGQTGPVQVGRIGDFDVHKVRVRLSFKFGAPQ